MNLSTKIDEEEMDKIQKEEEKAAEANKPEDNKE